MKIKYLGTAAAEGWPAVFCHCPYCEEARKRGGKEVRTRSQALINDDLMIDLPADTYMHGLLHSVDLSAVKYLFITHPHSDHFYPAELAMRGGPFAVQMTSEKLQIYTSYRTKNLCYQAAGAEFCRDVDNLIQWNIIKAYEPVRVGSYTVTPLPAMHMYGMTAMEPFFYLVEQQDKALLYMHDTGRSVDDALAYLQKEGKKLDFVSFDCTYGLKPSHGELDGHMGFEDAKILREKMLAMGICHKDTHYALSHFSHNNGTLHKELCDTVNPQGMDVAFDGMEVEI